MLDDNASEDKRLQESLRQKTWDETVTKDSWMVFKVMSEFVDGYEKLAKIGPCVSIFGSARLKPEDPYYQMAVDIARKITEIGFGCYYWRRSWNYGSRKQRSERRQRKIHWIKHRIAI